MVATNEFFFALREDSVLLEILFSFSAIQPYSVCLIHLKFYTILTWGLHFFPCLEKDKVITAPLLTIYLVLRPPYTISDPNSLPSESRPTEPGSMV